jgi:CRISPR-associated endonuclease/helicase Cas3
MLQAEDFAAFYRAVHGHDPFPWQADLVRRTLHDGVWPEVVDVPTGMGKTSMIDVGLFVTAATAHLGGHGRLGRRRLFFVVDRRIVVDAAWQHAQHVASALAQAEQAADTGVLGDIARALRSLTGGSASSGVVRVTRMRGGATWASSWLDRPDEVGVVVGTVDQIGSRLLFRGYGVSDRRKPLDAALTGMDSLVLVDEAHLAESLVRTLRDAHERDHEGLDLPRASVVRLSATHGESTSTRTYTLDADEHRDAPEAWRRLTAHKSLSLVETTQTKAASSMAAVAATFAESAGHRSVLVVCNTVDRARAVHDLLTGERSESRVEGDVWLLTGRTRPVDRQKTVDEVVARFSVNRDLSVERQPAVLVSTQTIEVGANVDADALVTESASWDSLVQRLGRLNRLGRHERGGYAVVVHDGVSDGPVYGATRDETWAYLRRVDARPPAGSVADLDAEGGPDVGPLSCRDLASSVPATALAPRPLIPLLQTATLDAWTQTGPVPLSDPPVEPFLHGFDSGLAGVEVAWRDGLTDPDDPRVETDEARADALLTALPVRAEEQMAIPFVAAMRWMRGESPVPVDDLDTSVPDGSGKAKHTAEPFDVLAWREDRTGSFEATSRRRDGQRRRWRWISADELRPGDTVVVPSARGGIDQFGWAPRSQAAATDVLEQAALTRRRPLIRLDGRVGTRWHLPKDDSARLRTLVSELARVDDPDDWAEMTPAIRETLREGLAASEDPSPGTADLLAWLDSGTSRLVPVRSVTDRQDAYRDAPQVWVLTGGVVPDGVTSAGGVGSETGLDAREDHDPVGTSVGGRVSLADHHEDVGQRAADIAQALGLAPRLAHLVEQAARWHDLGKLEERFQTMLYGDAVEAFIAEEPLAKSGLPADDRSAWTRARRNSGLPDGARHEAWSAALVAAHLRESREWGAEEADLLVHLVAAHHGHARPLLPPVVDSDPRKIRARFGTDEVTALSSDTVDLGHPSRFAQLNAQYGRWGLALLESIVRCADMTVSGETT